MAKKKIHINSLEIRLPRSAAGSAEQIANQIGNSVLRGVADQAGEMRGTKNIDQLNLGRLTLRQGKLQETDQEIGNMGAAAFKNHFTE